MKYAVVLYVKHTGVFVLYMAISYHGSEYCVRKVITRIMPPIYRHSARNPKDVLLYKEINLIQESLEDVQPDI